MKSKYDYSLLRIDYPDHLPKSHDKIRVICPIHGEFKIMYSNHKRGQGCRFCIRNYWAKENCIIDAKKYKTRSEWQLNNGSAYQAALRNKWLDDCCKHMIYLTKQSGFWTKENCIIDAKKYKTRKEWELNNGSACGAARKNKWMDECCKHMIFLTKQSGFWTKENCKKDAKKYKTRSEWELNSCSAYNAALKNKWVDDCCKHMNLLKKQNGFWTKENCIIDAKKYKTRKEWYLNSSGYNSAHKNKWLDDCCKHMIYLTKQSGFWTKENCIIDAKKYKTRSDWSLNNGSAYNAALKNKWLDDCCKHMINGNKNKKNNI